MPSYCTKCGAPRSEGQAFCTNCATRFDDEPRDEARPEPSGHGSSWYVGLSIALAVVIIGGAVGAVVAINHRGTTTNGGGGPISVITTPTDDRSPTEPPVSTETPTPPDTSLPTDDSTPPPPRYTGNSTVAVAPEAANNPLSPAVVALLTKYFAAINDHDYPAYSRLHTRAVRKTMSRSEFQKGFRSTHDDQVVLRQLGTAQDGRLLAVVDFVSTQDAADGPNGQTCTQWVVGKFLEPEGTTLHVGKAPPGYSNHTSC